MRTVRTRFAPSPTGALHLGNARTALFNWFFARRHGGSFILRIEDTDIARSLSSFEAAICDDLKWLGLVWDEGPDIGGGYGPYRQSERLSIYSGKAEQLIGEGKAYRCYCTKDRLQELKAAQAAAGAPSRYDGRCRELVNPPSVEPSVVRFLVPRKEVAFTDLVHGPLKFDTSAFGDFVIIGSDGVASYNFAVVIDDAMMEVSHVIRGDDHLSNTPRQLLLFEAMGLKTPAFSHVPLVLGADRTPLSKRHGEFSVKGLRDGGYLPEAVINTVARLGWDPGVGAVGLEEMSHLFSLDKLSRSASAFDEGRLKSFNKEAIQKRSGDGLAALMGPGAGSAALIDALKGNASTLKELEGLLEPFTTGPRIGEAEQAELSEEYARKVLSSLLSELERATSLDEGSCKSVIEAVKNATGEKGRRLLMPIRLALTGRHEGIELARVMKLLGRDEMIRRLKKSEK
ncbi:MAG: glutamate--tRNA ligase [Deltaproteobacteria bacterium GWC2_55_46]|nr:MAG: glutamate--tRNA ligase [Deltaproteobacteria bacterium GWA2_55_82]OGQ64102.1 MAG: glutamate--tRNA ligase [Deltaproteobacteria bacterium RIFCSPLOWO2_02_FULL_55_12]OIJ74554.1 MAG: glutamate--tRNA ligase [Deltaproteobacteria bacterium GWC2_55_46]